MISVTSALNFKKKIDQNGSFISFKQFYQHGKVVQLASRHVKWLNRIQHAYHQVRPSYHALI